MKKTRRNVVVFITALMMFATTGAGVFAAPVLESTADDENVIAEGPEQNMVTPEPEEENNEPQTDDAFITEPDADSDMEIASTPASINVRVAARKSKDGDKVKVAWDPVTDPAVGYITIDIYKQDGSLLVTKARSTKAKAYTAKELKKNTKYKFVVKFLPPDKEDSAEQTPEPAPEIIAQDEVPATPVKDSIDAAAVTASSTFKGVVVEWNKVKGAKKYYLQRKKAGGDWKTIKKTTTVRKITNTTDMTDSVGYMDKVYYYRVKAMKTTDFNEKIYSTSERTANGKGAVRQMYITVQPKMNRTLTSKDKYKKSHTFKSSETIKCYGYNAGCYYFKKKFKVNGSYKVLTYRIARINSRNQKAMYIGNYSNQTKGNYTDKEAELFINRYFEKSKLSQSYQLRTKYCIWVNYYTQHVYIFQYVNGKWVKAKKGRTVKGKTWTWKNTDWECSSGKASTPSYTGNNMINHWRIRSQVGIPYWNCYHGKNGIHGKAASYKLGEPHSHGCIRNENSDAKAIWDMNFVGTPVICY